MKYFIMDYKREEKNATWDRAAKSSPWGKQIVFCKQESRMIVWQLRDSVSKCPNFDFSTCSCTHTMSLLGLCWSLGKCLIHAEFRWIRRAAVSCARHHTVQWCLYEGIPGSDIWQEESRSRSNSDFLHTDNFCVLDRFFKKATWNSGTTVLLLCVVH